MATFIGYSTINKYKDYTVTDFDLIKRDLLNALNIRQGEMPGRPDVGTSMWSLIYEPQSAETTRAINTEIQRVCAQDPRITISNIDVFAQENGINVELELQAVSGQDSEMLTVFFDQQQQRAAYSDV
jgi:phage baseplate assembly protein W|tara:strand:+ start:423 stop:803 length:381 start_codon:yes stop_codon:yes gene_type:complete